MHEPKQKFMIKIDRKQWRALTFKALSSSVRNASIPAAANKTQKNMRIKSNAKPDRSIT
jgi:hypothetical protein